MDTLSSAEFRKTYAKLRAPTAVTALGRVIGQWIPEGSATYVMGRVENGHAEVFGLIPPEGANTRPPEEGDPIFRGGAKRMSQAERDAILRRMNKG